jgi:hypothetical protein
MTFSWDEDDDVCFILDQHIVFSFELSVLCFVASYYKMHLCGIFKFVQWIRCGLCQIYYISFLG